MVEQCGGFGLGIFRFKISAVVKSDSFITIWWNISHWIFNCGGTFIATYHIQGAGAPAKTKNDVNAYGIYIFSGKGSTIFTSCKIYEHNFKKDGKAIVEIKRDWFDTTLENCKRGDVYGRWKEKIQV